MGGAGIPSLAEPVCTSDAASDSVERDLPADCSARRSGSVRSGSRGVRGPPECSGGPSEFILPLRTHAPTHCDSYLGCHEYSRSISWAETEHGLQRCLCVWTKKAARRKPERSLSEGVLFRPLPLAACVRPRQRGIVSACLAVLILCMPLHRFGLLAPAGASCSGSWHLNHNAEDGPAEQKRSCTCLRRNDGGRLECVFNARVFAHCPCCIA
jgi:hypothetical protein